MKAKQSIPFLMFFLSGFCGLLYQIVWLRYAFSYFGVITPVVSVVISTFMLGLGAGSLFSGWFAEWLKKRKNISMLQAYGVIELLIGLGSITVVYLFSAVYQSLLEGSTSDSFVYLFRSALGIFIVMLPWCFLMGCTFPFMMQYIRENWENSESSFSFLYVANVLGAVVGTVVTALVLIEWFGLFVTLTIAGATNMVIAFTCLIGHRYFDKPHQSVPFSSETKPVENNALLLWMLFFSGFVSMGFEVAWTRLFTPVLRTTIYSFAALLSVYLVSTFFGSVVYRYNLKKRRGQGPISIFIFVLALAQFLPLLMNDPRLYSSWYVSVVAALFSIIPVCFILGYVTPSLIDKSSGGAASKAGFSYAVNIAGCFLGPLVVGYYLLPKFGVKYSILLLALPFIGLQYLFLVKRERRTAQSLFMQVGIVAMLVISVVWPKTHEDPSFYSKSMLRRDHVATTLAIGEDRRHKNLLVNGVGMTYLTPILKCMAHVPLTIREARPENGLVICLGMGATLRSMASWDIDSTAIELVPGVKEVYPFFFDDAEELLQQKNCRVIVDDGRRFLIRTDKNFDVITIDPPPPVESAGSSLLYSREFIRIIKNRLTEGGILQHWVPGGEKLIVQAVARSIAEEFPYVKVFRSIEGWGYHFTASAEPFSMPSIDQFMSRMPDSAIKDFIEWPEVGSAEAFYAKYLDGEIPLEEILNDDKRIQITDNRPYNEYFFFRRVKNKLLGKHESLH